MTSGYGFSVASASAILHCHHPPQRAELRVGHSRAVHPANNKLAGAVPLARLLALSARNDRLRPSERALEDLDKSDDVSNGATLVSLSAMLCSELWHTFLFG